MKKLYYRITIIFILKVLAYKSIGQKTHEPWSKFEQAKYIELGLGSSSYFGDIHPINNYASYITSIRWNANLGFTKHITSFYSIKLTSSWTRISGDDFYFTIKQIHNTPKFDTNFLRNLSFRNDLKEISFLNVINILDGFFSRTYANRPTMIPYVMFGLSIIQQQPFAREAYSPLSGVGSWKKINVTGNNQPIILALPIGIGIKRKFSKRIDLSFEINYRYTLSDKLDDIIKEPFPANILSGNTNFTNRSTEKYSANTGLDRSQYYDVVVVRQGFGTLSSIGNTLPPTIGYPNLTPERGDGNKDSFITTSIKVHYYLNKRYKCTY